MEADRTIVPVRTIVSDATLFWIRSMLRFGMILCAVFLLGGVVPQPLSAQFDSSDDEATTPAEDLPRPPWDNKGASPELPEGGVKFDLRLTRPWLIGIKVTATNGDVASVIGTIPVPFDWPEQRVKLVEQDVSEGVRLEYRSPDPGLRQMVVRFPNIPDGEERHAIFTLEITKHSLAAPDDFSKFRIPKSPPAPVKKYLGQSPLIETQSARIRTFVKDALAKAKPETGELSAWQTVETLYDAVRTAVRLESKQEMGAAEALKEGASEGVDMNALFVAACRIAKIPARLVWSSDECYSEVYLDDDKKVGHWFPAQLSRRSREVGYTTSQSAILEKGDNFIVGERKNKPLRFVPEFLRGSSADGGKPKVEFIRKFAKRKYYDPEAEATEEPEPEMEADEKTEESPLE